MNGEARNFLQASGRVFYHPESIGERAPVIPSPARDRYGNIDNI